MRSTEPTRCKLPAPTAERQEKGKRVPEHNDHPDGAESSSTEPSSTEPSSTGSEPGTAGESEHEAEQTARIPHSGANGPAWPTEQDSPAESGAVGSGSDAEGRDSGEESDAERTEQIAAVPGDFSSFPLETTQSVPTVQAQPAADYGAQQYGSGSYGAGYGTQQYATDQFAGQQYGWNQAPRGAVVGSSGGGRWGRRPGLAKAGVAAAAVVGVLALLYVGDLVFTSGTVPRGTVVAGERIGGMEHAAAERTLREQIGPRLEEPVRLQAGNQVAMIDPEASGLRMDWGATVEQAGSQPLNPFTRVTSLFTDRQVDPVTHGDEEQVQQAVQRAKVELDREPAEGDIRFEGTTPIPVDPETGRTVDVSGATDAVIADWAADGPVRVPFDEQPVSTTADGVRKAVSEIAEPAVSAPVLVRGDGKDARLEPEAIAAALKFEPNDNGGLKSKVDIPAAAAAVEPQLADTLKPARDAKIVMEGGSPTVKPSADGRGVDWERSFAHLGKVLQADSGREVKALYRPEPPEFNTEQAKGLGIKEKVGEFSTDGFEPASGKNIRRVAEQVNGAVVKPGETFSLNGHTGPRGPEQGYVESGIIEDGRPAKAVGGGISQFATTLYNASYFAGMRDVEHKAHSYYISRYPEGREATVFQGEDGSSLIDVKFKNVADSGIMITTRWTPNDITITLWGTKQFDVQSDTGERSDPKEPHEKVVPPDEPCSPSSGTGGFRVTDTRTIKDLASGEVNEEQQETLYEPQPIIHCGPPPPPPGDD